jgi:hypothetical protein
MPQRSTFEGPEDLVEPAESNLIRFPFERRPDNGWAEESLDASAEVIEKHHAAMMEQARDECGHPGCMVCYTARE